MKLRIISGKLKGRFLNGPAGKGVRELRPTLERTRQSVAEIIKYRIPDAKAADLCAGSGAFGFELISRGARQVDFIENDRIRAQDIKSHAITFGVEGQCRVIVDDIRRFVEKSAGGYDILFYDPPYDHQDLMALVPQLLKLLTADGILIYERRRVGRGDNEEFDTEFAHVEARVFGDTVVEFHTPLPPSEKGLY